MLYREAFDAVMHYEPVDAPPALFWGGWPETFARWRAEGLPDEADAVAFFGADAPCLWGHTVCGVFGNPFCAGLIAFPEEVLEETDDYTLRRDRFGVVVKDWKHRSSIPHYTDHTFRDASAWPLYKRMLLQYRDRMPGDIGAQIAAIERRGWPVAIFTGSLMGWARNWMGVENLSYMLYDDRDCFCDMVETISEIACWNIDRIAPLLSARPAMGFAWEDICGRHGPLVGPDLFVECVAPGYRRIRQKLEEHGIDLFAVDSDGDVSALVEPWLDAGVNVQFPLEVGPMRQDASAYRRRYGRELRMIGNFDKMTLEQGASAIAREFERLAPLVREGGYLLLQDHACTPGVSLQAYRAFFTQWREYYASRA